MFASFDETQQRFLTTSKVNPHLTRLGRTHSDFEFAGHLGRRTTGTRTNFCIQMNFVMRISFFKESSKKKSNVYLKIL